MSSLEILQISSLPALALIGVVSGFLNTVAGGGSMVSLPALIFFGLPSVIANGTNRIAIIAQAIPATIVFFRRGFLDITRSIKLAITLVPGAVIGAYFGTTISDQVFNKLVTLILIITAISMTFKSHRPKFLQFRDSNSEAFNHPIAVYMLMFLLGFYGGFIHIGIGFMIMFILNKIGGLNLVQTNMHKVIIIVPYSIASLIVFATENSVIWHAGLSLALGNMLGGWLGAHLTIKDGGKFVPLFFQGTIIILICSLIMR